MSTHHKKVGATGQGQLFKQRASQLPDAQREQILREKLYQKAKQQPDFRFYILYDKMFLPYLLRQAWKRVKAGGKTPGIDNVRVEAIEQYGVDRYLEQLGEELRTRTYRPQAVKRVMIPKANGGQRPLGIPTLRDRIAQNVAVMILEPIFEADFEESSYGFRPGRSAKDAMAAIKANLKAGKTQVYDADLSRYFDSIPHDRLMKTLNQRITDPRMLKLIHLWLKAPVVEDGVYKGGKKHKKGTPQGGVISPLLANIYLHLLDRIVNKPQSLFVRYGVRMVRYADDFVLMAPNIPLVILHRLKRILTRMGLTLNEQKTHLVDATKQPFDFLGLTVRYDRDLKGRGFRYWNLMASKKSEKKLIGKTRTYLSTHGHLSPPLIAEGLNQMLRGWLNYFDMEGVSYLAMNKRRLRYYLSGRLHRYYGRKSQRKSRLYRQNAFEVLVSQHGLIDPTQYSKRVVKL